MLGAEQDVGHSRVMVCCCSGEILAFGSVLAAHLVCFRVGCTFEFFFAAETEEAGKCFFAQRAGRGIVQCTSVSLRAQVHGISERLEPVVSRSIPQV